MAGADWQASSIRAALFTQQALPLSMDVFSGFAGVAPDVQEDRPKEGMRRQAGGLDEAELQVIITPIRVDIILAPPAPKPEQFAGSIIFATGELKAELAKFERRLLAWLPRWEIPTTRVSLVVLARVTADSAEAAYEILKSNLSSVRVRPGEMSDLLFRVNWKAKTKLISEGYYNRLGTWSSVRAAVSTLMLGGPGITIESHEFAQVEMDINTPSERTQALPATELPNIYREFFHLAAHMAEVGEGP